MQSESAHGQLAQQQLGQPIWGIARAIPVLGDTPAAVNAVTTSLNQVLDGLTPAATSLANVDPAARVQSGGRVDLAPLQAASKALDGADRGIANARATWPPPRPAPAGAGAGAGG